MKTLYKATIIILMSFGLISFSTKFDLPKNWFKAGSHPSSYEMGIDRKVYKTGNSSATIQSTDKKIKGFGTLMQVCSAESFLGKKIKMSGFVKSEEVDNWAGLWLRIDSKKGGPPLGFDNMQDRAIKGTTDWKKYEIILDVPDNSYTLNYGALLSGTGKIWFDDLKIEIVADNIETTGKTKLLKPANLSFED